MTWEPIEGAEISINSCFDAPARTRSDGRGYFVAAGDLRFTDVGISAPGYAFGHWHAGNLDAQLHRDVNGYMFPLDPGGRLRGRVVFEDGEPVDHGRVTAVRSVGWVDWAKENPWSLVQWSGRGTTFRWTMNPTAELGLDGSFDLVDLRLDTEFKLLVLAEDVVREFQPLRVVEWNVPQDPVVVEVTRAPRMLVHVSIPVGLPLGDSYLSFCTHEERCHEPSLDQFVRVERSGTFSSGPLRETEAGTQVCFAAWLPNRGRWVARYVDVEFDGPEVVELRFDLEAILAGRE